MGNYGEQQIPHHLGIPIGSRRLSILVEGNRSVHHLKISCSEKHEAAQTHLGLACVGHIFCS